MAKYTQKELDEFTILVDKTGSLNQLNRIEARIEMPRFIKKVGREKCDAMFEVIKD